MSVSLVAAVALAASLIVARQRQPAPSERDHAEERPAVSLSELRAAGF